MNFIASNLRHLIPHGEAASVAAGAKIQQSWLNRIMNPDRADGIREPKDSKLEPLARHLGVTLNDLRNTDLTKMAPQSQAVGINEDILASSIVSVKKALERKGLMLDAVVAAPIIAFAYRERVKLPLELSRLEYDLFDRLIETRLDGSLGDAERRERPPATKGPGGDAEAAPGRTPARRGAARRKD